MRVQIVNGEAQYAPLGPIRVRETRIAWEYQTVTIPPASQLSMPTILNPYGTDGWETSGIQFVNESGTTLLLKRPR